jgi:hypothetical protein
MSARICSGSRNDRQFTFFPNPFERSTAATGKQAVATVALRMCVTPAAVNELGEKSLGGKGTSIGKKLAMINPTPNTASRASPIRDGPGSPTPCRSPTASTTAATPQVKRTEAKRKPSGPTAYSLIGLETGLRSGRRMCMATVTTRTYAKPIVATAESGTVGPSFLAGFICLTIRSLRKPPWGLPSPSPDPPETVTA